MNTDNQKRLELIRSTFNSLSKNNMEILKDFYAEDIEFTDPVTHVKGLQNLTKYYSHVYGNVIAIKFDFHEINSSDDTYFAKWTMTLQVKGLNSKLPYPTEGLSVMKFNSQNKVIYHRDYLDLGSMVYEQLPVLGPLIKLIKKKLG